jgi:hypothetical protein
MRPLDHVTSILAIDLQPYPDYNTDEYNIHAENDIDQALPDFTGPDTCDFSAAYDRSSTRSLPSSLLARRCWTSIGHPPISYPYHFR